MRTLIIAAPDSPFRMIAAARGRQAINIAAAEIDKTRR